MAEGRVLNEETQDKNTTKKSPYYMESAQLYELYGLAELGLIALPNDTIKHLVNVIRDRDKQIADLEQSCLKYVGVVDAFEHTKQQIKNQGKVIAELRERLQIIENNNQDLRKLYRQEVEQNTIMREALEFYGDDSSWITEYYVSAIVADSGAKAQEALAKLQTFSREQTESDT